MSEYVCLSVYLPGFHPTFLTANGLTASSWGNTFLPFFVTSWDAQNWPNKCNLYANARIHYTHFVFMPLANVPSLQMWPEPDAVSQCWSNDIPNMKTPER